MVLCLADCGGVVPPNKKMNKPFSFYQMFSITVLPLTENGKTENENGKEEQKEAEHNWD